MDFLSKTNHESKPTSDHDSSQLVHDQHHKPSNSELFNSAKVVAEAAQAHFRHEPEKYDKGKVAGAAADLLNCASEYGKLDDGKGIGKYVDKAEDYLRNYKTTHTTTTTTVVDPDHHKKTTTTTTTSVTTPDPGKGAVSGGEGGGIGNYIKMAEGFLHKP